MDCKIFIVWTNIFRRSVGLASTFRSPASILLKSRASLTLYVLRVGAASNRRGYGASVDEIACRKAS